MESISGVGAKPRVELSALFSDLVRLETELWDRVDRRLRDEHDLPLSWFEPMLVIDQLPDCRVADIARALSITVGGTSKLVDRIERSGWCHRTSNPDDARSSILRLTRAGRRLLDSARRTLQKELEQSVGVALAPARLAALASAVEDLRAHLANSEASTS